MSSDGSEVWSIESRKSDEQVELEIISQAGKKIKARLPFTVVPQSTNFDVKLKDALLGRFKKGEIVWFSMDGSNWPCIVLDSFSADLDALGASRSMDTIYNSTGSKSRAGSISSVSNNITQKNNNTNSTKNVQKKDKIWKIWPGASVFKRNIFGRKLFKYSKNNDTQDSEDLQESDHYVESDHDSDEESSNEEIFHELKKRKLQLNYRNQYDLLPLPLSIQILQDLWTSKIINVESKMEKVDGNYVKPWLHKDTFPIPSDDIDRNLSLLQAIHTSCSWSIPEADLRELKQMESKSLSSFINVSIQHYRHGTEIITIGDFVRLVTNLRRTRNVISNQTTQLLYVASLNVVSQLSHYQYSSDTYWDHEILLYGLVYEPRGSDCISTGEYRTVTTDGICGRWYSSLLNINRKMPSIEESSWVL